MNRSVFHRFSGLKIFLISAAACGGAVWLVGLNAARSAPASVPKFSHVIVIIVENKEFEQIIGNANMPIFNNLAKEYTLLTQYYAASHASLPNYIALIFGNTFGIKSDCQDRFVNAGNLPDLQKAGLQGRSGARCGW